MGQISWNEGRRGNLTSTLQETSGQITRGKRESIIHEAALFDMKQAVEGVRAASRLVPLARRRAPPRLASARSTC